MELKYFDVIKYYLPVIMSYIAARPITFFKKKKKQSERFIHDGRTNSTTFNWKYYLKK